MPFRPLTLKVPFYKAFAGSVPRLKSLKPNLDYWRDDIRLANGELYASDRTRVARRLHVLLSWRRHQPKFRPVMEELRVLHPVEPQKMDCLCVPGREFTKTSCQPQALDLSIVQKS